MNRAKLITSHLRDYIKKVKLKNFWLVEIKKLNVSKIVKKNMNDLKNYTKEIFKGRILNKKFAKVCEWFKQHIWNILFQYGFIISNLYNILSKIKLFKTT